MNTEQWVLGRVLNLLAGCAWITVATACLPAAAQVAPPVTGKQSHPALNAQPSTQQRATTPAGALAAPGQDRGIIIVSGRPANQAELNPQPLPPRSATPTVRRAHEHEFSKR